MRHGFVDTSAGQLHYVEAGSGPHLLLIPHAGRSSRMYVDLIQALKADFHVISLDVPGTGLSCPIPPGDTSMAKLADVFVEALDGLNIDKMDVFGLHGGNKVGGSLVARYPDRVRKFVYAGQSHSIIADKAQRDEIFRKTPSIASVITAGDTNADPLPQWTREFRENSDYWWGDPLLDSIRDPAARNRVVQRVIDNLQAFQDRPRFYKAAFAYDMEADLRAISVPTLIMELTTPREDRDVGRQGEALSKLFKNAELTVLESPDVYAVTLEDRAIEVADILRSFFLRGT